MKTQVIACAMLISTAVVVYAWPMGGFAHARPAAANPPVTAPVAAPRPLVEVVFVLDTTSSMGGLIDAAKQNIWSIASRMASAQPQPELRIGLVAFRDRGDDYVTRVIDLSDDLDSMYATLMDFAPQGGGDGPESVNQALYDAVHRVSWSQSPDAYRVIFLVGDAEPHMDYPDDVKYPVTLAAATARGIVVNTIQAGENAGTQAAWMQIAQANQGAYFKVSQGGDAIALATPFDADMARLSRELDETRLFYGDADTQARAVGKTAAAEKLHAGGSVGTIAQRAAFNASEAGARNFLGEKELVEDVASGRVDLASLDRAELPAEIRELPAEAQQARVVETKRKRDALSADLNALAEQRQNYIEEQLSKDADAAQSLDFQILDTVRAQAAKKGLSYK